jgi:hypothetical protein
MYSFAIYTVHKNIRNILKIMATAILHGLTLMSLGNDKMQVPRDGYIERGDF